jgi:hypothetical protein
MEMKGKNFYITSCQGKEPIAMREFVTLMYFRSRGGKVRSLKISKNVLNVILIVSVLVVFFAVFSTSLMINLYLKNRSLLNELNASRVHKELLGEKKLPVQEVLPRENIKPSQTGVATAQKAGSTAAEEKKIFENKIFVKNSAITEIANGKSFKLKFDIVKGKDIDGKKITGSIVVLGKMGEKYFAYPPGIAVKEGSPLNYAKGERFVFRYRKTFEKAFPYPRSLVEALTIFIYDEEGGLLLKENIGL